MKEPDPPDDLEQTILETFDELHAEAKIVPMVLLFPPEVIECIKTYTKEHSLDPANLIPLAMKAITRFGGSRWIEEVELLMEDPDLFEWPLEDPLLCVAIAFMRKYANRWTVRCAKDSASPMTMTSRPTGGKGRDNADGSLLYGKELPNQKRSYINW